MIISFHSREEEKIFNREHSRNLPLDIQRTALRKMLIIDAARDRTDLQIPPSNQLEKRAGKRRGQYSIRINKQWAYVFIGIEETLPMLK